MDLGFRMHAERTPNPNSVKWVLSQTLCADTTDYMAANDKVQELINAFVKHSDYEMECREIVGREFEGVEDHAAHVRNGGCAELIEALNSGHLGGAALDVQEPEPLPAGHPLWSARNVIITPHLGSATVQTRQQMAEVSCANLLLGLEGKPLLHQVRSCR